MLSHVMYGYSTEIIEPLLSANDGPEPGPALLATGPKRRSKGSSNCRAVWGLGIEASQTVVCLGRQACIVFGKTQFLNCWYDFLRLDREIRSSALGPSMWKACQSRGEMHCGAEAHWIASKLAALQLVFFASVIFSNDFDFSPGECAAEAR
jgi:hypothetical protein